MEQSPLINMKKEGEYWRVDAASYPPLIAHLKHYFRQDEPSLITDFHEVLYADIDDCGLCLISPLFGAVHMDSSILIIKGLFPEKYIVTWEDCLTLHLCVGTDGCRHLFMLRLKMKLGK